jgi:hypothetical protein
MNFEGTGDMDITADNATAWQLRTVTASLRYLLQPSTGKATSIGKFQFQLSV